MELNRLLEITNDREQCAFCADEDCTDICAHCDKVKPITEEELQEYFREVRWLISENVRLRGDLELAVQDINGMASGKYNACNFCGSDCSKGKCSFLWRGGE